MLLVHLCRLAMCGRYSLILTIGELQKRFEFEDERLGYAPWLQHCSDSECPDRRGRQESRRGGYMRWGLVPLWAKDMSIGSRMINARSETVAKKPSFRNALRRRRCLPSWVSTSVSNRLMVLVLAAGLSLEQPSRNRHLGQLKDQSPRVPHQTASHLDQLDLHAPQRPVPDRLGQA